METIIANLLGSWRYETRNGKQYLVVPMSLIVPGVLNGSQGPLLYRPEELSRDTSIWNGMPLVYTHPTVNGIPVSARDPDILDKYGIGWSYRTTFNNKLVSEGWIDVEAANRVEPRIVESVTQNKKVELSTGLFTERVSVPDGSVFNNVFYKFDTKNYKPDHIAVLLEGTGACSIAHGCGLNVNQLPADINRKTLWEKLGEWLGVANSAVTITVPTLPVAQVANQTVEDIEVNKTQLIDWLVTNCECWKGTGDKETLNKLDEAKLKQLKDSADKAAQAEAVANAAKAGFSSGNLVKFNEQTKQWEVSQSPSPVQNSAQVPPVQTASALTAEQIEDLTFARNEKNRQKAELIQRLVANMSDADKVTKAAQLQDKPLSYLQELVQYIPQPAINPQDFFQRPVYSAAGGGAPITHGSKFDEDDVIPIVEYEEAND